MVSKPDCRFSRSFNRLTDLPPLPEVANKLGQLSEEEASHERVVEIVDTDRGVTVKVLKPINSASSSLESPGASESGGYREGGLSMTSMRWGQDRRVSFDNAHGHDRPGARVSRR